MGQAEENRVDLVERRVGCRDQGDVRRERPATPQALPGGALRGEKANLDLWMPHQQADQFPACVAGCSIYANADHTVPFQKKPAPGVRERVSISAGFVQLKRYRAGHPGGVWLRRRISRLWVDK